jgi:hypothetical protein
MSSIFSGQEVADTIGSSSIQDFVEFLWEFSPVAYKEKCSVGSLLRTHKSNKDLFYIVFDDKLKLVCLATNNRIGDLFVHEPMEMATLLLGGTYSLSIPEEYKPHFAS